jgi:membrane protease YdiL (CAAX protease family)
MDWALLYYCWAGVHHREGTCKLFPAGAGRRGRALLWIVAIALPFWGLWEGAAFGVHWLLGPNNAKTVESLLPRSLLEILVWIGVSITAGVCEEMAFRGYLQKQFEALVAEWRWRCWRRGWSSASRMPIRAGRIL